MESDSQEELCRPKNTRLSSNDMWFLPWSRWLEHEMFSQCGFFFEDPLDEERLKSSLNKTVGVFQVVSSKRPTFPVNVEKYELKHCVESNVKLTVDEFKGKFPFKNANGVIRVYLDTEDSLYSTKLPPLENFKKEFMGSDACAAVLYLHFSKYDYSLVYFVVHHCVCDAFSIGQLFAVWMEFYKNEKFDASDFPVNWDRNCSPLNFNPRTFLKHYRDFDLGRSITIREERTTWMKNLSLKRGEGKFGTLKDILFTKEYVEGVKKQAPDVRISTFDVIAAHIFKLHAALSICTTSTRMFVLVLAVNLRKRVDSINNNLFGNAFSNTRIFKRLHLTRKELLAINVHNLAIKIRRSLNDIDDSSCRKCVYNHLIINDKTIWNLLGKRRISVSVYDQRMYQRMCPSFGDVKCIGVLKEGYNTWNIGTHNENTLVKMKVTPDLVGTVKKLDLESPEIFMELKRRFPSTHVDDAIVSAHRKLESGDIQFFIVKIEYCGKSWIDCKFLLDEIWNTPFDTDFLLPTTPRFFFINRSDVIILLKWIPSSSLLKDRVIYSFSSRLLVYDCPTRIIVEANSVSEASNWKVTDPDVNEECFDVAVDPWKCAEKLRKKSKK